ncbi:uncharacterized protein LOC121590356 [Anopheles merus]|uniref:DUF4794 domain-containing protein n=1 Tax=Anopheles merus TaxID=30066 RepID=A0A340TB64_ANOME|nr:uncharacterized protein LOC121590356 [Anopheles merus]
MVKIRSVVFAVCLTVAVSLFCPTTARPQFSFLGGIGVQTPVGGVHLGVPTGLTVNVGRQPVAPKSPAIVTPLPEAPQPIAESSGAPEEDLGTRLEGASESAPDVTEAPIHMEVIEVSPSGEIPCQKVELPSDPSNETIADNEEGNTTELPCLGIGAGNRISPKQAALLSLVG